MKDNYGRNEFLFPHCTAELDIYSKYMSSDDIKNLKTIISKIYGINQNITLTHGSEDSLYKLLLFFRTKFSKLIVTDISWDYYKELGRRINFELCIIPSYEQSVLDPNIEILEDKITNQHCIIIGFPCNPSGKQYTNKTIQNIIKSGATIIMDCTYQTPLEFKTTIQQYFKYTNIVFITSFSKYFGLPGLRLGFFLSNNATIHTALDLYLGINATYIQTVNLLLNNLEYYQNIKGKRLDITRAITKNKFTNFNLYSNVDYYILIIFKHFMDESIISSICNLFNCKVKLLFKNNNTLVRINVSSKNENIVLNILQSLESFINFLKDNRFYLLRHEERNSSLSYGTVLTKQGYEKAKKINIPFGTIFSSSYVRCIQTILPFAKNNNVMIYLDYSLDEYECIEDKIYFENDTIEGREVLLSEYSQYYNKENTQLLKKNKQIFNKSFDTYDSKKTDIMNFLIYLWKQNTINQNYIICSHQTTLAILIKIITFNINDIPIIEDTIKMGEVKIVP
jgi:histidinol-phosphate aminotransferase